jgi:hypothetical protein
MLSVRHRFELFVATVSILAASSAWSQSIGGGRGPTGSNLTSGLGFGNAGFGSNSLGSSGMGGGSFGSGLGQGGLGQGGLGQGGLGQSGFGATGFGGQTGMGQSSGGFIGRDSSEVTAMFENMSRQGQQFMNRVERSVNRSRNSESGGAEQIQQQIRVQLRVGFDPPEPASSPIVEEFTSRLAQLLAERQVANVSIERDRGNVTVTGMAADTFERMVVEQILLQQPGVTNVTNRMSVGEVIDGPTLPE